MTNDERIRQAGFRILARRPNEPATWERDGVVADQKKAIAIARHEEKKNLGKDRIKVG